LSSAWPSASSWSLPAAEQREYDESVERFAAFLEPYVDQLLHARVLRRVHRGRQAQWLLAAVHARSQQEASGTTKFSGLAQYEHEEFG
jgi:hypothetical protein